MASVDTPAERVEAEAMGWRTFRVRLPDEALLPHEAICPASAEAGHKLTCEKCMACDGANGRRGRIAIVVHCAKLQHQPFARYVKWRSEMQAVAVQ